jgi:hypothetical protein
MDMAEEHRQPIGRRCYECAYELHQGVSEMYVSDERFKAFHDSMSPGPPEHLRAAITADATRHTS